MSVSIDGTGSLIGVDQGLNIVGLTTLTGGIILDDSISHIGDTDTKIRFPAADTFAVETAGTERLRIESGGDVDIKSGVLKLASGANRRLMYRSGNNDVILEADGGDFYRQDIANSTHEFFTGNTERLRITSGGIIQCGTSSTLKAEINNAVSGHQFISQCSDNNNGFEVYQQLSLIHI